MHPWTRFFFTLQKLHVNRVSLDSCHEIDEVHIKIIDVIWWRIHSTNEIFHSGTDIFFDVFKFHSMFCQFSLGENGYTLIRITWCEWCALEIHSIKRIVDSRMSIYWIHINPMSIWIRSHRVHAMNKVISARDANGIFYIETMSNEWCAPWRHLMRTMRNSSHANHWIPIVLIRREFTLHQTPPVTIMPFSLYGNNASFINVIWCV